MIKIDAKTLQDLEFATVLQQVSELCITDSGKEHVLQIQPFSTREMALTALEEVNEYFHSFTGDNPIPNHGFDKINRELQLLQIQDTMLEVLSFRKILHLNETTTELLLYFEKNKTFYEALHKGAQQVSPDKTIALRIKSIINRFGEIRDDASAELAAIRKQLLGMKSKINSSFTTALSHANTNDYLDEIKESVIDNHRVLAVKAMHRKKVKGTLMGTSKTGSIVYIEPEATIQLSRALHNLLFEEQEEINRILKELTDFMRPFRDDLSSYQEYLTEIDSISARAKYALKTNSVVPRISEEKRIALKDAYHPLLLLSNQKKKQKTYPQTIALSNERRILVISGPNAGGKSITLKTVGLLQVMLQSGMLIPVHPQSEVSFFDRILTDIGDNQSIENHLSTYSYRLKMMNRFLKKCNANTLFLIDEFGTGSDPELGGALAETFLEVFYEKESFGIITTHYTNLKMLANELPFATNANMQFDQKSLEPTYKLFVGEAGSSFTFEVAQKNGIPYSLINKAKKKIERSKVRFDKTIADLQKERSKMQKTSAALQQEERKTREEKKQLSEINSKIQQKLESYQELYDSNQRYISLGKKLDQLAEQYFNNKRKKQLIDELTKIVAVENAKRKKQTPKEKKEKTVKETSLEKEVQQKIAVIRHKKKEEKEKQKEKPLPQQELKIGDRVRMKDGKSVGTLDQIEKKKGYVNYGVFTTQVDLGELEFVERPKTNK